MRAMIVGVIALSAIVGTYLYVMALCYLCDLYERKKLARQEAEERKRKEELKRVIEETEMRRKMEIERRKKVAAARRQQGLARAGKTFV